MGRIVISNSFCLDYIRKKWFITKLIQKRKYLINVTFSGHLSLNFFAILQRRLSLNVHPTNKFIGSIF